MILALPPLRRRRAASRTSIGGDQQQNVETNTDGRLDAFISWGLFSEFLTGGKRVETPEVIGCRAQPAPAARVDSLNNPPTAPPPPQHIRFRRKKSLSVSRLSRKRFPRSVHHDLASTDTPCGFRASIPAAPDGA